VRTRRKSTAWIFDFPDVALLSLQSAGDLGPSGARNHPQRDEFLINAGFRPQALCTVRQVHSRTVQEVSAERARSWSQPPEADGIVTADPGVLPAVTVADCMPIFLSVPEKGIRGILHSGWKGTGIVEAGLDLIRRLWRVPAADVQVLLGPAIGRCCYRVDRERAFLFSRKWGEDAVAWEADGPHLDLVGANVSILDRLGVQRVRVARECTVCNTELGSFRREGADRFTRMLAVLGSTNGSQEK